MLSFNSPIWLSSLIILTVSSLVGLVLASGKARTSRRTIPSPRTSLSPSLSHGQRPQLPYPPDIFPGARDVDSPYGVMRVYEWGPEDGRKVVMIHGDTTPAPMLGPIAKALVERGCRVLLLGERNTIAQLILTVFGGSDLTSF